MSFGARRQRSSSFEPRLLRVWPFDDALSLQIKVHAFVTGILGEDHPLSIKITLLLSGTLWELSRTNEATQLQRRAHQLCEKSLGLRHPLSLRVADLLGSALCFQGRLSQALKLTRNSAEGMACAYADHDTLRLSSNLGRVCILIHGFGRGCETS